MCEYEDFNADRQKCFADRGYQSIGRTVNAVTLRKAGDTMTWRKNIVLLEIVDGEFSLLHGTPPIPVNKI